MAEPKSILVELTEQFLPQMEPAERRAALTELQGVIDAEFFRLACDSAGDVDIACPHCGSVDFVKRGRDALGKQRYKCRDCGRSFGGSAKKIFGTTKLPRETWSRYAECFVDGLSLRDAADKCGVCLKTSFFMRHRLLEALAKHMPSFQVEPGCGAELDETFFPESFKGNHSKGDFEMPRKPRRHGGKGHPGKKEWQKRPRGVGREQICVLTGVNDEGDVFYELAGRSCLTGARASELLKGKIEDGAIISTDRNRAYGGALRELNVAAHNAFDSADHKINRINNVHSRLDTFMRPFHGVATRRLENYLAWFKWRLSFEGGRERSEMPALVVKQAAQGTYDTTWREYRDTPYPFWDYWEGKAAA